MSFLLPLTPRPIRDLAEGYQSLRRLGSALNKKNDEPQQIPMGCILGIYGGGAVTLPLAEKMIKGALRVGVAAAGAFAYLKTGSSPTVSLIAGSAISLQAVSLTGAVWLACEGSQVVAASLASGALEQLGIGAAMLAGAWAISEYHDIFPVGLAEAYLIDPIAKQNAPALARYLIVQDKA